MCSSTILSNLIVFFFGIRFPKGIRPMSKTDIFFYPLVVLLKQISEVFARKKITTFFYEFKSSPLTRLIYRFEYGRIYFFISLINHRIQLDVVDRNSKIF